MVEQLIRNQQVSGSTPLVGFFYLTMENDKLKATGLDEAETQEPSDGSNEWDRDTLLINLELRFAAIKRGSFACYGKYILPLAIAFSISGALLFYALSQIEGRGPVWIIISADVFLIIGIFLSISMLMMLVIDRVKRKGMESVDKQQLADFNCKFFAWKDPDNEAVPSCGYFNRDLEENPLCIICPVYKEREIK